MTVQADNNPTTPPSRAQWGASKKNALGLYVATLIVVQLDELEVIMRDEAPTSTVPR